MTDKEKLEAIRAEIHRLVDVRGYDREMANDLFAFMDSLPNEPVSEDFEKIVEEIAEPTILNAYGTKELARRLRNTICGTSVSEDLEEASKNYALNNTPWDDCKDEIQESFKAGFKLKEQQMMAKAIDGKVLVNGMGNPILHLWDKGRHLIDKKVKVIVIKED